MTGTTRLVRQFRNFALGGVLTILATGAALASEPVEQHNSNAFWFENWRGLSNATLTVAAPDGRLTEIFAATGTPVFHLSGSKVLDGVYRYELSAATDEQAEIINPINNGRGENQRDTRAKPFFTAGHFTVSRGVIITPEDIKEDN
ncbi:hypothetical protein [Shimia biformata]|uniref:hypothetical protein n=1 Tax=Shimia biformata TaxID=1294299 RepID=UPI0019513980|nr:hypothetical protein [Shimia biformata]